MAGKVTQTFDLEAWQQIKWKLLNVPDKLREKILRQSLKQAGELVRDQAKENFDGGSGPNVVTGALQKSIRVSQKRGNDTWIPVEVVAGQLTKAQQTRFGEGSAYWAMFVEKGHWINNGKALGGGAKSGKRDARVAGGENKFVAPRPYLKPALESQAGAVVDMVQIAIADRLEDLTK